MAERHREEAFIREYESLCRKHGFFASADDDGLPYLAEIGEPQRGGTWSPLDQHIAELRVYAEQDEAA